MIFLIVSILVPILLLTVFPRVITHFTRKPARRDWVLIVAACAFFVAWYLPSPLVAGQQTQFVTHFVGGGLFTGLVWLYLKRTFDWRPLYPELTEPASLFALVSSLGVLNELFELTLVQFGLVNMTLDDTSWDFAANTLGALALYLGYLVVRKRS